MKQDGKEVEVIEEDGRRIFYIDVSNMPATEALKAINDIRKRQGLARVSSVWIDRVLLVLIGITAIAGALSLSPEILALLSL